MLYKDISETLKEEILGTSFSAGDKLPSEVSLAERFNTTKSTIRKALKILVDQGFVHVINQSGYYVNDIEVIRSFNALNLQTLNEVYRDEEVENEVLFFGKVLAPKDIASKLGIKEMDNVHFGIRTRKVNGEAIQMESIYIPVSMFPKFSKEDFEGSIYDYIETKQKISYSIKNINAGFLPLAFEKYIPTFANQPLLIVENVSRLKDGRIFEYSQNYHLNQSFTMISHRN